MQKGAEKQKTSLPKESVENADLHKTVLNKIIPKMYLLKRG